MKQTKRIISMILALAMVLTMLPATVLAAEQPNVSAGNDTPVLQGSNGFGDLLVEDINKRQEAKSDEPASENGYSVSELLIDGNTATVNYTAAEPANLVVAIYTDDGMKLISSGNTLVDPEKTETTVTIAGTMPEYFLAAAYLVNTYDMSPLCKAYETPMYTKDMQELLASTVDDYDSEKVLQLDDDNDTNFAVFSEATKVIAYVEGRNIVTSVNKDTSTYVISNADSQFTGLKVGDIVAYAYDENEVLIVKVATKSVSGTTVTLTGSEVEIEDVFQVIKIEAENPDNNVIVDTSTMQDGVSYNGMVSNSKPTKKDVDGEFSTSFEFTVDQELPDLNGFTVKLYAKLGIGVKINLNYYKTWCRTVVDFVTETEIKLEGGVSGKKEFSFALAVFYCPIIPGVIDVTLVPTLEIEVTAKLDIYISYKKEIGFQYDSAAEDKFQFFNPKGQIDVGVELSGKLSICVDLKPQVQILAGVLSLGVGLPIGVEIEAKKDLYQDSTSGIRHNCSDCWSLKSSFVVGLDVELGALWVFDVDWRIAELKIPLGEYFYSVDNDVFATGSCPNLSYKVTAQVLDHKGNPLQYVNVSDSTGNDWGKTNFNGSSYRYLQDGSYVITVSIAGTTLKSSVRVNGEAQKIVFTLPENSDDSVTEEIKKQSFADLMDRVDSSVKEQFQDDGKIIDSGSCGANGENVVWVLYASGHLQLAGNGAMADYASSFDVPWYQYRSTIADVTIGQGITSIGAYAFYGCKLLDKLIIPTSVSQIGMYAFRDCANLRTISELTNVTDIGNYAFGGCVNISAIRLTNRLVTIGERAFNGCTALTELIIPNTVATLGSGAFYQCSNIVSIDIPKGITNIASDLFYGCTKLANVTIPDSVITIGNNSFYNCASLDSIVLPDSLESIGKSAFYNCSGLKNITFPASLKTVGETAFYNCDLQNVFINNIASWVSADFKNLGYLSQENLYLDGNLIKELIIPEGVTYIRPGAFRGCTTLLSAKIANTVTNIGDSAFYGCTNLTQINIPEGIKTIGSGTFYQCRSLSIVTLPTTLTSIGDSAFYHCDRLKALALPSNLISIGYQAFGASGLESVEIPNSVTGIGNGAFAYCSDLANIILPSKLTDISANMFAYCTSLTGITLPATVTTIGESAFEGCSILKSISLPSGLTSIGSNAFYQCVKLSYIEVPTKVTTIGSNAFYQCTGLTTAKVLGSKTSIGYMAFAECSSLSSLSLSNGSGQISDQAFYKCTSLKSVSIPSGIKEINYRTFAECTSLYNVYIPSSVTFIGSCAFENCTGLRSISIPSSVTTIYGSAFRGSGLTSITIPGSVGSIANAMFMDCINLSSVTIGSGITSIEGLAFEGCKNLSSITIPASVTSIGSYAFQFCNRLTSITFKGDAPYISSDAFYGITANAYCPSGNSTWTTSMKQNYGGTLTWSGGVSTKHISFAEETTVDYLLGTSSLVQGYSVIGGSYETEDAGSYILKTATFTGLKPGVQYTMLSLGSLDAEDVLAADNLLYIAQAEAGQSGILEFKYIQRVNTDPSYVFLCGPADLNIKDAIVTFPEMETYGELITVNPSVVYNGKVLVEGVDYVLSGDVSVTLGGQYSCTIHGINDYTGSVEYTYSVGGQMFDNPSFKGVVLTLQSNLTVSFKADKAWMDKVGYTNPYAVFSMNGLEYTVSDFTIQDGYYLFALRNITPNNMNDTFTATLYATNSGRVCCSEEYSYSIAKYCYNLLEKTTDAKTRTLAVDLLNYGAATQLYSGYRTDALVNSALSDEQKQYATQKTPTMNSVLDRAYETVTSPEVTWKGAYLVLVDSVAVQLKFSASNIDGLSLKVRTDYDEWTIECDRFIKQNDAYIVVIDELNAVRMRDTLYLTFCRGKTAVSNTLRYSIESYAFTQKDSTDKRLGELVVAMMKYGDAARIYDGYEDEVPTIDSGVCGIYGDNISWKLDENGLLTISGSGIMATYTAGTAPWFANKKLIKTVKVCEGVSLLGAYAFTGCNNMQSITLPNSLTEIGRNAFQSCTALTSVSIPDSVETIGLSAFNGCTGLVSVSLSQSLIQIKASTFSNCRSLTGIMIPASVADIHASAFTGCRSLTEFVVDKDNQYYAADTQGVLYAKEMHTVVGFIGPCTDIVLPKSIIEIAELAFGYDVNLTSIKFIGNAPEIAATAFKGNTITVYYPTEDATWTAEVMNNYGGKVTWQSYDIPKSGECGVNGSNITWSLGADGKLTLTGSGDMADFTADTAPWDPHISSIKSLSIDKRITSIGNYAFYNCYNLTNVTIPSDIRSIGEYAFSGCAVLSYIDFIGNAPVIARNAFLGVIATAFYDASLSSWTDSVRQNYGGEISWSATIWLGL